MAQRCRAKSSFSSLNRAGPPGVTAWSAGALACAVIPPHSFLSLLIRLLPHMRFPILCALALVSAPLARQQAGTWDLAARTFPRATPPTRAADRVALPRRPLAVT